MLFPARAEVIGGTHFPAGSRIGLFKFDPEQVIHHAAQHARLAFKPEETAGVSKIKSSPSEVCVLLHARATEWSAFLPVAEYLLERATKIPASWELAELLALVVLMTEHSSPEG